MTYFCRASLSFPIAPFAAFLTQGKWSPTGLPVVSNKHTHLGQGFGGSSTGWRNPPKHSTSVGVAIAAKATHSSKARAAVSCVGG